MQVALQQTSNRATVITSSANTTAASAANNATPQMTPCRIAVSFVVIFQESDGEALQPVSHVVCHQLPRNAGLEASENVAEWMSHQHVARDELPTDRIQSDTTPSPSGHELLLDGTVWSTGGTLRKLGPLLAGLFVSRWPTESMRFRYAEAGALVAQQGGQE
jgi:hypothetical protein